MKVFKKFPTIEDANQLAELLVKHNVPYILEDYSANVDIAFMGQNLDMKFVIKANLDDFPAIEKLIDDENQVSIEQVDKEHYLFEFTDEELTEIILKPNEWSNYDYKVAEWILNNRGVAVSKEFIENVKKQRYREDHVKESYSSTWIIVGYVSAFLGGFLGLAIGLGLWFMKKQVPGGKKVYVYDEKNRLHGKRITILGFIMTIFYLSLSDW